MKLSTKGQYGARVMVDLATHYGEGPIPLRDIAKRQELSERYLEHLMLSLKAAGLVRSSRGAHGGFILARVPSQVKVSEVIQVLEGSMAPVHCVDDPNDCGRSSFCVTRDVWVKMKEAIVGVLESLTLQDLVRM